MEYVGSENQGEVHRVYMYHFNSVLLIKKENHRAKNTLISFDQYALTFNTSTHTCVVSMHFKNASLSTEKRAKL